MEIIMNKNKLHFTINSFFLFNKEWVLSNDSNFFLKVFESNQPKNSNLALPVSNKKRIIDEGIRYFQESCQLSRSPKYLTLTENIIKTPTEVSGVTYEQGYLKLVISKDEAGFAFFAVQTVFSRSMIDQSEKSIDGLEVEKIRLSCGDLNKC